VHDIEECFVDLTNVVEEGNALDAANGGFIEARGASERHAVGGDATDVCARDGIVGIDGIEQRFECRRGESRGAFGLAVLSNEDRADADAGEEACSSHGGERGKNETDVRYITSSHAG
jgi:hypothetical protein